MTQQVKRPAKAKRKLSEISFEKDNAHIAVVTKQQGGPASGHAYSLIIKGSNFSEEFIQKVQQVKVTMELPEFLQKFFYLYSSDAEVLAAMMGYVEPEEKPEEEIKSWVEERLSSFELIKSLHESKNLPKAISELTEDQYFSILKDQEMIEKALSKESKPLAEDTSIVGEVNKGVSASVSKQNSKGNNNMEENVVELQKALDEQKAELQKALDLIKAFEQEKKATVEKARKDSITAVVKDAAKAEVLFKAVKEASEEDFAAVVKALGEIVALADKSELFVEKGADVEGKAKDEESPVAKVLKAKYKAK